MNSYSIESLIYNSIKIAVFGTGRFFRNRINTINDEIVVFLDNDPDLWNTYFNGCKVISPNNVRDYEFDYILLMSVKADEMRQQLLQIGVNEDKIMVYDQYLRYQFKNVVNTYGKSPLIGDYKKRIALVTVPLDYNGGSIALIYAARALMLNGYYVEIVCAEANSDFFTELINTGMVISVYPYLDYANKNELWWFKKFDAVFINTFQMSEVAKRISSIMRPYLWIHEASEFYEKVSVELQKRLRSEDYLDIDVLAVSPIAEANFQQYFSDVNTELFPYGIPDTQVERKKSDDCKIVIAIIGVVNERKAQKDLLDAVRMLESSLRENLRILIIGTICEDEYSNLVRKTASEMPEVEIKGNLSRSEMDKVYSEIDIVVNPSKEDPLPITITEGMMNSKVCICSDKCGQADFIKPYEDGLVCRAEDTQDLADKIEWCLNNRDKWKEIGQHARKLYEQKFSMESFGRRLVELVERKLV